MDAGVLPGAPAVAAPPPSIPLGDVPAILDAMPGAANLSDALLAPLFDLDAETYGSLKRAFAENARHAAADLLADEAFAAEVDALPFAPGEVVVGDINAGMQGWRQLFTRPAPRFDPYSTPNRRLYFCSASTPPGGGVHGMSGYHGAKSALNKAW